MKQILVFIAICYGINLYAQQKPADRVLYGKITTDTLLKSPYVNWYKKNYDDYKINDSVKTAFKKLSFKGIKIEAFFGSWCGDSKRELPRFLKVLDEISFNKNDLSIIGTGGSDSLYKQSPQGEEKSKGIFRVPVFIIYRNGAELNRINEFPVASLERDLLLIIGNDQYTPNYRSFSTISGWLKEGVLSDSNVSVRGLMNQLKPLVNDEHELNSLGYLLLKQQKKREALKIFLINANLYPESANTLSSLGEAYLETGDTENAVSLLERSLDYKRTPALTQEILRLLYKARGL
jgi:thiol-disulfide isomerase/thioredoxin